MSDISFPIPYLTRDTDVEFGKTIINLDNTPSLDYWFTLGYLNPANYPNNVITEQILQEESFGLTGSRLCVVYAVQQDTNLIGEYRFYQFIDVSTDDSPIVVDVHDLSINDKLCYAGTIPPLPPISPLPPCDYAELEICPKTYEEVPPTPVIEIPDVCIPPFPLIECLSDTTVRVYIPAAEESEEEGNKCYYLLSEEGKYEVLDVIESDTVTGDSLNISAGAGAIAAHFFLYQIRDANAPTVLAKTEYNLPIICNAVCPFPIPVIQCVSFKKAKLDPQQPQHSDAVVCAPGEDGSISSGTESPAENSCTFFYSKEDTYAVCSIIDAIPEDDIEYEIEGCKTTAVDVFIHRVETATIDGEEKLYIAAKEKSAVGVFCECPQPPFPGIECNENDSGATVSINYEYEDGDSFYYYLSEDDVAVDTVVTPDPDTNKLVVPCGHDGIIAVNVFLISAYYDIDSDSYIVADSTPINSVHVCDLPPFPPELEPEPPIIVDCESGSITLNNTTCNSSGTSSGLSRSDDVLDNPDIRWFIATGQIAIGQTIDDATIIAGQNFAIPADNTPEGEEPPLISTQCVKMVQAKKVAPNINEVTRVVDRQIIVACGPPPCIPPQPLFRCLSETTLAVALPGSGYNQYIADFLTDKELEKMVEFWDEIPPDTSDCGRYITADISVDPLCIKTTLFLNQPPDRPIDALFWTYKGDRDCENYHALIEYRFPVFCGTAGGGGGGNPPPPNPDPDLTPPGGGEGGQCCPTQFFWCPWLPPCDIVDPNCTSGGISIPDCSLVEVSTNTSENCTVTFSVAPATGNNCYECQAKIEPKTAVCVKGKSIAYTVSWATYTKPDSNGRQGVVASGTNSGNIKCNDINCSNDSGCPECSSSGCDTPVCTSQCISEEEGGANYDPSCDLDREGDCINGKKKMYWKCVCINNYSRCRYTYPESECDCDDPPPDNPDCMCDIIKALRSICGALGDCAPGCSDLPNCPACDS